MHIHIHIYKHTHVVSSVFSRSPKLMWRGLCASFGFDHTRYCGKANHLDASDILKVNQITKVAFFRSRWWILGRHNKTKTLPWVFKFDKLYFFFCPGDVEEVQQKWYTCWSKCASDLPTSFSSWNFWKHRISLPRSECGFTNSTCGQRLVQATE